jgi:hypothetical protein
MGWLVQPLLFFLARCTRNQLIRNIEFLKAENEMLRKRVPKQRIHLQPEEQERLLKLRLAIGPDLKDLSSCSRPALKNWSSRGSGL